MACDKVDTSLITNDHRKCKLAPYANNPDNISADKEEVIKRMKLTSSSEQTFITFIEKI